MRPEPRSAAVAGCWFQLVGVRVDYESRAPLRIKPARCPALRTIPAGKRRRTSVVHAEIVLMVGRIAWVEGHMLGTCRPLAGGGDRIEQCQHPQQKRHRRTVPAGSPRKEARSKESGAADAARRDPRFPPPTTYSGSENNKMSDLARLPWLFYLPDSFERLPSRGGPSTGPPLLACSASARPRFREIWAEHGAELLERDLILNDAGRQRNLSTCDGSLTSWRH